MSRGPCSRLAVVVALLSVLALVGLTAGCGQPLASGSSRAVLAAGHIGTCRSKLKAAGARGEFAFLARRDVSVLDLPDCRVHVLVPHGYAPSPPLRFSADGRYLAYGDGAIIAARGHPPPEYPLGKVATWAWSPHGAELAAVTDKGGVELWRPGHRPRQLLPDGWAAGGPLNLAAARVVFSPNGGQLALARTTDSGAARELWLLDLRTGRRLLLHRVRRGDCLILARFTPDGRGVLFWPDAVCSVSIAADGLPLDTVSSTAGPPSTLVKVMLTYPDFLAPCRTRLIATVGMWRETNTGKSLSQLSPPTYRAASLALSSKESWVDPSCSNNGAIAVAAGPASQNPASGLEHRAIWLIPAVGQPPVRLTTPGPRRVSDELPRISQNGRYILFIRGRSNNNAIQHGKLELLALHAHGRARLIGPIAQLGQARTGYYDYYPWYDQTDWHAQ